ncbi:MAG: ATP-binding cassette domain-containing protein, partial [Vicinamibacterales bacterium]|nr:ATP-binding cassette domain-containing protein [Vicinamibacterales bacterium]
ARACRRHRRQSSRSPTLTMPLLEVEGLVKRFVQRRPLRPTVEVHAVNDVSFTVGEGESFGLVGESGSGKTTAARCILRLTTPTAGEIRFDGEAIGSMSRHRLRALRRAIQPVFQDPYESLNPRLPVGESVAEPLVVHRIGTAANRQARVEELLHQVGLDPTHLGRLPGELSGGQRQRIALARALALGPRLVVLDEPVSALDASVGAQIVNLLMRLQRDLGLALLFITHDLRLVRHMTARVAVMRAGRIVETAATPAVFAAPRHPYTRALLATAGMSSADGGDASEELESSEDMAPLREVASGHWARV